MSTEILQQEIYWSTAIWSAKCQTLDSHGTYKMTLQTQPTPVHWYVPVPHSVHCIITMETGDVLAVNVQVVIITAVTLHSHLF